MSYSPHIPCLFPVVLVEDLIEPAESFPAWASYYKKGLWIQLIVLQEWRLETGRAYWYQSKNELVGSYAKRIVTRQCVVKELSEWRAFGLSISIHSDRGGDIIVAQ